jgi:hypothetical protein
MIISTRPNLIYLKAAWAAHASISAENCRQSYEDAGISFERINHSWIVRKNGAQVSTMPLRYTRQELRMGFLGRIEMEARKAVHEMETILWHELELPDGHAVVVELEDGMRRLRRNGHRAVKIFIGPSVTIADSFPQFFAEIHVFLDAPRACLFVHQRHGKSHAAVDLLANAPKRKHHPRASTYAELASLIATTIQDAIEESSSMVHD